MFVIAFFLIENSSLSSPTPPPPNLFPDLLCVCSWKRRWVKHGRVAEYKWTQYEWVRFVENYLHLSSPFVLSLVKISPLSGDLHDNEDLCAVISLLPPPTLASFCLVEREESQKESPRLSLGLSFFFVFSLVH